MISRTGHLFRQSKSVVSAFTRTVPQGYRASWDAPRFYPVLPGASRRQAPYGFCTTAGTGDKPPPPASIDTTNAVLSDATIYFPDPHDPEQHPLASMTMEEIQQRKKHLEKTQANTHRPVYRRKLTEEGEAYAIGSRKRSKAQVWIGHGDGQIAVNGKPWVDYFVRIDHRDKILRPFGLVGLMGKMDVRCTVRGGGVMGQAEAIRHGISRALQNWDPLFRPTLKQDGLLTRDSREVESKKYGKKKARKSFQWVKR